MTASASLDLLAVNTVRTLALDAIDRANSGHPGLPLGAAPMAYVLFSRHLKFDPAEPGWEDRDRFVLSAGHGSALQYALLHVFGYDVTLDDLRDFRQWGAKTPGHPELGVTPGVEATTGPLGQGTANAVGMAIAERFLAHRYHGDQETVDHMTWVLVGDGDFMEGIAAEAASLAGHLGLGKLVCLYDANDVTLDGPSSLCFTEDVGRRYEACGWQVLRVENGDEDLDAIDRALAAAKADTARPSLVIVKTTIGYGSPHKAGTAACHGSPLGAEETALTKRALGWEYEESFHVPDEVRAHCAQAGAKGAAAHEAWRERFAAWSGAHPGLAEERRLEAAGELPAGWDDELPVFEPGTKLATRVSSGKILNAIAGKVPWILGGDADLSCSTKTALAGEDDFDGRTGAGRNLHFGVREHAMGAIANGMAYHGGVRPYTSTFFVFSDYQRPAMRLAAMNSLPVLHIFTHDSIALGEDGPTHQPIEHLASLRAMPGLLVLRPAEASETAAAWRIAMTETKRPTVFVLSRQGLPTFERAGIAEGMARGAYVLSEARGAAEAVLIATGAEVHLAVEAQTLLAAKGHAVRVVSMPSQELFSEQDATYRDEVLPPELTARVSIEAAATFGWSRWVGDRGLALGIDRFGASAPASRLFEAFGFTAERIVTAVESLLG